MRIRVLSDLHLEMVNGNYALPRMEDEANTVLCYAGDLGTAGQSTTYCDVLEEWCSRFKAVVYTTGNHESYRTSLIRSEIQIKRNVEFELQGFPINLHCGDCFSVIIDNTVFICATLWTDMDKNNPTTMFNADSAMNDYSAIRYGSIKNPYERPLRPLDTMSIHKQHKQFIFDELEKHQSNNLKTVVMTHHAPSYQSIAPNYIGDGLNGAYVSEIYDPYDTDQRMPLIHIHGHVHDSFDYQLKDTRVICNPRGYYPDQVNPDFNPHFVIEI